MWFFTADLHLNHSNIIKYAKRPFVNNIEKGLIDLAHNKSIPWAEVNISAESTFKMTDTIIDSINFVVGKRDHLVIIGDFCYSKSQDREKTVAKLRSRIRCNDVHLILGNHDDAKVCQKYFICSHQYMFKINGQNIFTNHYPCRSWNKSLYGSWMLYGHVHGSFVHEDIFGMSQSQEEFIREKASSFLKNKDELEKMINIFKESKPRMKTLDVGIDARKNDKLTFGTPWSFDEIKDYMENSNIYC